MPLPPTSGLQRRPRIRSGLSGRGRHGGLLHPRRALTPIANGADGEASKSRERAEGTITGHGAAREGVVKQGAFRGCASIVAKMGGDDVRYYSVLYTKRSKKKSKTYLDGYIIVKNDRFVELQTDEGKRVTTTRFPTLIGGLKPENLLEFGSIELLVQQSVSGDAFLSGRLFLANGTSSVPAADAFAARMRKNSAVGHSRFKPLRAKGSCVSVAEPSNIRAPLYDPSTPNAVLIQESYTDHTGARTTPIVLDPYLGKHMRPHQREGVRFLYKSVQGKAPHTRDSRQGAILADSMGLGKSLQAIALLWTLLKQGPAGQPLARKAIIVCPASLVQNWVNEVKKWLGFERLKPAAIISGDSTFGGKEAIADFLHGKVIRLLIVSYEMFRSYATDLYKVKCGILICDEGHRLKSAQGNKTIEALRKIPCRRRIILTGTPVQNDLEEFFSVCNFVNPGALGSLSSFRNIFASPILASRDAHASSEATALGAARAAELHRIASQFVLRRNSSILEKYLPPKWETAVFCRLTKVQARAYRKECELGFADLSGGTSIGAAFSAINRLRKICSHPVLVKCTDENENADSLLAHTSGPSVSIVDGLDGPNGMQVSDSGKMQVAISICKSSVAAGDRLILVSNFTATLDLLQIALSSRKIEFCRLDGATPTKARGGLVHTFNQGRSGHVFLLSAKAGGVGLNLIGANRLVLFDPDWNPATDLQAMARVWRDGQKKHVYVYRLLSTSTIEEKIYQRQLFKGELQTAIGGEAVQSPVDSVGGTETNSVCADGAGDKPEFGKEGNFSAEELRDLFQYSESRIQYCETLDVLGRSRDDAERNDQTQASKANRLLDHFCAYRDMAEEDGNDGNQDVGSVVYCDRDSVLDSALNEEESTFGIVSYMFTQKFGNEKNTFPHRTQKRKFAPEMMPSAASQKFKRRASSLGSIFNEEDEVGGVADVESSDDDDAEIQVMLAMRQSEPRAAAAASMQPHGSSDLDVQDGIRGDIAEVAVLQNGASGAPPAGSQADCGTVTWDEALGGIEDVVCLDSDF